MLKRKLSPSSALVLICVVLASAAVLMTRAGSASASKIPDPRSEARVYEQSGLVTDSAPIIRVWVHLDDIYPDSVKVRAGRALLMAENERTTDISLIVERVIPGQSNQAITSISASNIAKRAGTVLDLSAGKYIFYEQTRPDLTGTIFPITASFGRANHSRISTMTFIPAPRLMTGSTARPTA